MSTIHHQMIILFAERGFPAVAAGWERGKPKFLFPEVRISSLDELIRWASAVDEVWKVVYEAND